MPIVVNTNVSAINAQRSLFGTDRALSRAMERLSTGMRINRAADDAAGLAIATGMQTQSRGLAMAVRNVGDGLSAIASADGAVNTQVEILQRVRELAVQASSGLNTGTNLEQIQTEINEQISELSRVGSSASFNGKNLIDGTFSNIDIQVGANAGQSIELSIGDFRASGMGAFAEVSSTTGTLDEATAIDGTGAGVASLLINNVTVGASVDDGVSNATSTASAIAKANAINLVSGQTGVQATAQDTVHTSANAIGAATTVAGDSITLNGVEISGASAGLIVTTANDGTGSLRAAINGVSNQTGVVATLDGANKLVLTAADGRNIDYVVAGAATAASAAGDVVGTASQGGEITLTSNDAITVTAGAATLIGIASGATAVDQSKTVDLVDVTATGGASDAIRSVDSALETIGLAQAELGGVMNRLENTVDNLNVSIENLAASESRIRDADFAVETSNLVRAQILQQAGVAILAQANLRPQAALSLLG